MNIWMRNASARGEPAIRRLRRLGRCESGEIAVEFAFIVPILLLLMIGAADFGRLGMRYAEAQSVANAGVHYAVQNQAKVSDVDGIAAAALADAMSPTMAVTVGSYCQCANAVPQSCGSACDDDEYAPMYVSVTATDTLDLLFPYPAISKTQTITAASEGRVR